MTDSGQPFRRQVLLNTASTGAGNAWAIVVGLASLPLLLHGLGPAAFGQWVLLQTFSATTGWLSLGDLGVDVAASRALASRASVGDDAGAGRVAASALALFAVLGAIAAVVLATLGTWLLPVLFDTPDAGRDGLRLAVLWFAGQTFVELVMRGSQACLEGLQRVDLSRLTDAVRRTLVAVVTIVVAQRGGGLAGVAAASMGGTFAGTVTGGALLARLRPAARLRPDRAEMRSLLAYGRRVVLLKSTGVVHRTMDRMVVGVVLGPARVVAVEIATQIQNAASAVLAASSYTALTSAPWLRARAAEDKLRELLEKGTRFSLLVTMPVVAGSMVLAGPFVRLWVGERYDIAGLVALSVLYIGVAAPLQVASNLLQGVGRAGTLVRAASLAVTVNLVLSVVLVHLVGVAGVFEATLVATLVLFLPLMRATTEETGVTPGHLFRVAVLPVVPPTSALVAVAGLVVLAPLDDLPTVVLGGTAGAVAYVVIALRWALPRRELAEMVRLVLRRP